MTCTSRRNPARSLAGPSLALFALLGLTAACGSGGSGSHAVDPGNGGGPGGPGGTGNPLDIELDFQVANAASVARTETILASVPFPEGGYQPGDLANMIVSGHQTAWQPLQYWADGRVKVAQAQFTDVLEPGQTKHYVVARDETALAGAFTRNAWVDLMAADVEIGAEVRDTFHVPYRSFAAGFASGGGTVLQTSPLVETRRWRTYHTVVPGQTGIGRDYLTSTFYVTEYRDMPIVVVDWILGNDYLGADTIPPGNTDPNLRALGVADVRAAHFLCRGATVVLPYRAGEEGIEAPVTLAGNYAGFRVMQDTYLGDAQTRRYRFLLGFAPPGASTLEVAKWQDTANAMQQRPLYPLATQTAWQQTGAAGLLGGPIAGPGDAATRATNDFNLWAGSTNLFGTWGTHGDSFTTGVTGTPRNQPLTPDFAHAIQGGCNALLQRLEQMAWTQALRPYHLWNLQVGAEQQILLWSGTPALNVPGESLGRRAIRDNDPWPQYRSLSTGQPIAHGWEPFDTEHWSCDLLFDYWTASGDPWAKEELRQIGQSLKGLMRLSYYYTGGIQAARAEGWCMQGWAEVWQATRDLDIKTFAMRRVNEVVDVQRRKNHPSRAMTFQSNYPNTGYPMNHEFFMPWQHGAVLHGYLGAYKAFQEPILLQICEDVVDTVEYSWVTNVTSPTWGFVPNGLRYYVPASHNGVPVPANYWDGLPGGVSFGDAPLGGAHGFLIGGLHHLALMSLDPSVQSRALLYGGMLRGTIGDFHRWNKWWYCLPAQFAQ